MSTLDNESRNKILQFQKNEITEHWIYKTLARFAGNEQTRKIINRIADEELRHYHIWEKYSGQEVKADNFKRCFYAAVSLLFGLTFGIKLMEGGEKNAQAAYAQVSSAVPEAEDIYKQETEHEHQLIRMINEEKLAYMGSVVLGLNDALVEFTGSLAGFTFALQNSRLIGVVGLIMGIAASLSMAASEYLSTKVESEGKSPGKASLYTGAAYIITVLVLVFPYLIFPSYYFSLLLTMIFAVFLILIFSFYVSVVKETAFKKHFTEMLMISMGVAVLSFLIGLGIRKIWHIDV